MITEERLKQICEEYNINCEQLIKTNPNILEYGNENDILYVLDFLKKELNIDSKNIEKCPSILSFGIDNIKDNYRFLQEKEINEDDVETCLHILSTEPIELKKTYEYIEKEYGVEYLNKYTSILRTNVERIKDIEDQFTEFNKIQVLQASISRRNIEELENIVEVCRENGIKPEGTVFKRTAEEIEKIVEVCKENEIGITGSVFMKSAEEIEKIVEVCKENEIEITGTVFQRTAKEIEKIVEVCKENEIKPEGTVFQRTAEEIEKILEVCEENKIKLTGSVFLKTSKQLQENVDYIKEEFGQEYLMPLIVSKSNGTLKKVLPYLREKGYLEYVKGSASILGLTLEQIQERERFIEQQGESIIDQRGKFNLVFGLSKKNYEKRVSKTVERPSSELVEVVKNVPVNEVRDGKKVLDEITAEKEKEGESIDGES